MTWRHFCDIIKQTDTRFLFSITNGSVQVMENITTKLWNKDFILLLAGMSFNLFANAILRFVLPLYILMESGDPSLMALVMTLSAIPLIILSPIGGILADRINRKKILVIADITNALAIIAFIISSDYFSTGLGITVLLFIILTFEGLLTPAQESSVPALVPEDKLLTANSMTFLIMTITSIISPILAGIFLARDNLLGILLISIASYIIATFFKSLINMPYVKQGRAKGIINQASSDLKSSIYFMRKENPVIGKITVILFFFCMFMTPILLIGLPVLITGSLNMGEINVGISTGIKTIGSVGGLALIGLLGDKVSIKNSRLLLMLESLMFVPVIISLLMVENSTANFLILTVAFFIMQIPATMMVVIVYSHVQKETPDELVGKVMALVAAAIVAGGAIGGQFYGELFAYFNHEPWVVLVIALVLSLSVTFFASFDARKK